MRASDNVFHESRDIGRWGQKLEWKSQFQRRVGCDVSMPDAVAFLSDQITFQDKQCWLKSQFVPSLVSLLQNLIKMLVFTSSQIAWTEMKADSFHGKLFSCENKNLRFQENIFKTSIYKALSSDGTVVVVVLLALNSCAIKIVGIGCVFKFFVR